MSALLLTLVAGLVPLSSEGAPAWILAAGPVGAFATYFLIYRYYRNGDKTHEYERDTIIKAGDVGGGEEKIDHISRTRDSDIDGDNSDRHRDRVRRVG